MNLDPSAVVVASVSGGKDSAAMCLYLQEQGIRHRRVFADTGWEARETYEYLRGPLTEALGAIDEVSYPGGMEALCIKKGMFPSRVRRFCTSDLKVRPLHEYMLSIHRETGREVVNAIGIRAAESAARSALGEWDGVTTHGVFIPIWRPLLHWTEKDVIEIHHRHNLAPNPLYLRGASRVGCWPCIQCRKSEIRLIADMDPSQIDRIEQLETQVGNSAEKRGAPRPYFFRAPIAMSDGPCWPIRKIVEWSRTARGGTQFELFDSRDPDEGCTRWGLCEAEP